ncbi:MAG: peptide chain release factor N(5)-glutamine methyltransferase [Betaproteobacteria bacterium]
MSAESSDQILREDSESLASVLDLTLDDARREIRLLLTRALQVDPAHLLAHPERIVEAHQTQAYGEMYSRRLAGEPIAYILREREFYGLMFEVDASVLIPRPETELLVDVALEHLAGEDELRVLDIGTGSGCIAVTIAKLRPQIRVIAIDVSRGALAMAARNADRHAVFNLELRAGNWFAAVAGMRFHMIVSNPPYVAQHDQHLQQGDLRFEPSVALVAGADGLEALREIIGNAPRYLLPNGWLCVEHGYDQADAVVHLMRLAGLREISSRADLAGIRRIAAGRLLEATS